jgi:hypothetical protein
VAAAATSPAIPASAARTRPSVGPEHARRQRVRRTDLRAQRRAAIDEQVALRELRISARESRRREPTAAVRA